MVGRPDLVLGHPARQRAAVGLVGVTAGSMGTAPWRRLWFAALVETLRSGVQPFQVSLFCTGSGAVSARGVELQDLSAMVTDLVAAVRAATPERPAGVPVDGFGKVDEPAVAWHDGHQFRPGPVVVAEADCLAGSARAGAGNRGSRPAPSFRHRPERPTGCDGVRAPQVAS